MATRYQVRRGTAAEWTSANPILASGEMGYETDTSRFKIGDGSQAWSSLPYAGEDYAVISAKGDIIVGSADNTATRIAVGIDGEVLTADSTQSSGVKWSAGATPGGNAGGHLTGTYPNPSIATGVVTSAHLADGTIVDADISATAAISPSKIAGTVLTKSGPTAFGSVQSATVSGNDFALNSTTTVLKQTSNTSATLTGLTGGTDGRLVLLFNAGTGTLTLSHNSSLSTVTNRFALPSSANYQIPPNQGVVLAYDATNSLWYAFSSASGSLSLNDVGSMTSATFAGIISDETGSGKVVFSDSPILVTPNLGTPSTIDLTNATNLPISSLSIDTNAKVFLQIPSANTLADTITSTSYTGSGSFVRATSPTITTATLNTPAITNGTIYNTTLSNVTISSISSATLNYPSINYATATGGTYTSITLVTPVLGTPQSGTLSNCTGYPVASLANLATNAATFLTTPSSANLRALMTDETGTGLNYFQNGDLGTPSAGVLSSCTGLPVLTGVSGLGTGVAAFLANPTSSNLNTAVTGDSGTGSLLFSNSPSIDSPTLVLANVLSATNGSIAWDNTNKKIVVGDGTTARDFASSNTVFNTQTSSYTLVLSDKDKMIETNSAGANTLTVPLNSAVAFPAGTQIRVIQLGAGQTTIAGTAGVTLRSRSGFLKISAQYGVVTLVKSNTADTWYVYGDLAA